MKESDQLTNSFWNYFTTAKSGILKKNQLSLQNTGHQSLSNNEIFPKKLERETSCSLNILSWVSFLDSF